MLSYILSSWLPKAITGLIFEYICADQIIYPFTKIYLFFPIDYLEKFEGYSNLWNNIFNDLIQYSAFWVPFSH